jgi:hypothetical protein
MAYSQNTIVSANAADALVTALKTLLTSAGWTNVETLSPSGGTFRTDVWKSSGSSNAAGYDWYIALKWNTIGTEQCLEIIGGAAYDTATHRISQVPAYLNSAGSNGGYSEAVTGDMFGSINVNVAADLSQSVVAHGQGIAKSWFNAVIPSSAFAYWASVTRDHFTLFTTIVAGAGYCGYSHITDLILDPTYKTLAYTNHNPLLAFTSNGFGLSAGLISQDTAYLLATSGFVNDTIGTVLPTLSDSYQIAEAWKEAVYIGAAASTSGPSVGWSNGSLREGIYIGSAADTFTVLGGSIGDTVVISGATYVLCPMAVASLGAIAAPTVAVLVE